MQRYVSLNFHEVVVAFLEVHCVIAFICYRVDIYLFYFLIAMLRDQDGVDVLALAGAPFQRARL